ncbi:UpxY family transcription antiterminator [Schleiferiaceae bacterium]|nr:UpxY family transcription antiterminator [Schleiferiaceae bacterium]
MEPAPASSMESHATSQEAQLPWLVIYTKPRQEKKLAERLQQAGHSVYCPTHRIKKQWSDRWKWVEQPLFTSHIFIQIEPERRDAVYFVPGFVRFLFWLKKPAQVRPQEIEMLKKWLNDYTPESLEVHGWSSGQKVTVQSGPFQGQLATLTEQRGQHAYLYLEEVQLRVRLDLSRNELISQ